MKACTNKPMNGAKLGAWVAELEDNNAKLVAELEQALKEAVVAQNSLSMSHEKLEEECTGVRAVVDAFEQEKAKTATDHEAEVAAAHKYF
jgi:hypothetical protein